jgi:hypothetical protein
MLKKPSKIEMWAGMVVHTVIPALGMLRKEDQVIEASLNYTEISVTHTHNQNPHKDWTDIQTKLSKMIRVTWIFKKVLKHNLDNIPISISNSYEEGTYFIFL